MLMLLCTTQLMAQTLTVVQKDGTETLYNVADIDSIVFAPADNTEPNLWQQAQVGTSFYYAPNWNQLSAPQCTLSDGTYTVVWHAGTYAQWQAQMFLKTNLATRSDMQYDFALTLQASKRVTGATVKLYQDGNDNLYFFSERINLEAGTPYHFQMKNLEGLDISRLNLVLDFGGNASATTVQVSDISLQEHEYRDPEPAIDLTDYNLVFFDEFNAPTLVPSKWTYQEASKGWVNNELQYYVKGSTPRGKKVLEIKDGTLRISAVKEDGKVYSARIYGRRNYGFKYCYIEARIKLPQGRGTWPAFWMMPVNYTSWPADGEIDIMEEVGADPGKVSSSIHCTAYNHPNNTQKTHEMYVSTAESSFHVYAMEWTADYIRTYVDGKPQLTFMNDGKGDKKTWPFNTAFYPIFNLAWGGDWGGYKGVDESALPATMEVDYIRVYQK